MGSPKDWLNRPWDDKTDPLGFGPAARRFRNKLKKDLAFDKMWEEEVEGKDDRKFSERMGIKK